MREYEGLILGDYYIVCDIDLGTKYNNVGEYWQPAWVAECLICEKQIIVIQKDIDSNEDIKCKHIKRRVQ